MRHNASSNRIASYKSAVTIERSRHRKQKLTSKSTSKEKTHLCNRYGANMFDFVAAVSSQSNDVIFIGKISVTSPKFRVEPGCAQ